MSEGKVITALLTDKQIHHMLQGDVEVLFPTHADIWNFIKDYYAENSSVPPLTLVSDRFPDFVPEKVVGSTKHHLNELRTEHLDRELRTIIRNAATDVQDGLPHKAMRDVFNSLRELNKEVSVVKDTDATDTESAVAHVQNMIDNNLKSHGVRTGIQGLDMCFPAGIRGGQLGVVLAFPSVGKSMLSLYVIAQAWLQGFTPMIISLEMTESEVRNRLYAILGKTRWSLRKLAKGEVDIEEFERWHSNTFSGKQPFHIISTDSLGGEVTPEVIRSKIDQYQPDIVVADYMQLMSPNSKADNEVVRMKNLSRELKLLAMSERVPIIAISSATPTDAADLSSAPTLGQTAWSRQIAYDADWLLSLGRDLNSNAMEVVGRKNREGMLPDFLLEVDFDKGVFNYKEFPDDM